MVIPAAANRVFYPGRGGQIKPERAVVEDVLAAGRAQVEPGVGGEGREIERVAVQARVFVDDVGNGSIARLVEYVGVRTHCSVEPVGPRPAIDYVVPRAAI